MFSHDFYFYVSTTIGLGYLFFYAVARTHLEDVLSKPLAVFNVKQIAQENIGMAIRRAYGLPTYYATSNEFLALGLHRDEVTEANVLARAELLQQQMAQAPWAYPPSQHTALAHVTANARILAKCIALCKKYDREFHREEFIGALI